MVTWTESIFGFQRTRVRQALLENTYPGATIEIDGITLTVDVPDPDRQVSPARVFKSGSEGHEPFPEPVYLCKNSDDSVGLIGSAEPLFPVQFTGSSVVEIKGQEIRVFSWNRGLKNKAASKFRAGTKGTDSPGNPKFINK